MQQPDAGWVSSLACGHETRTQGRPRDGSWISCRACQCQRRVTAVRPVPVVYVQEVLL